MLRAAQKSIMLWDPAKGARKPPKESADLIFSVGELFDLPRTFQRSVEPDLVLKTIGNTTRGAIERAYDWLIPIISFLPDTISRLPASASCFLLLRAYGTDGDERTQLQELSAPLLVHVRNSLMGKFGEADAIRAFDLLLTDVASPNQDRRRCARRVLNDAIGKEDLGDTDSAFNDTNCSWMIKMLDVKHSASIVSHAIKYIVSPLNWLRLIFVRVLTFFCWKALAASFERERTLRFIVLALERLTTFATEKEVAGKWHFPSMLIELISKRPNVFAATMGSFPDLRSLAIRIVHHEFTSYKKCSAEDKKEDTESAVEITLCCEPLSGDKQCRSVEAVLSLSLLKCSCVLLSIWLEGDNDDEDSKLVRDLVKVLMRPQEVEASDATIEGLASAKILASGQSAIPVESVSSSLAATSFGIPGYLSKSNARFLSAVGNAGEIPI